MSYFGVPSRNSLAIGLGGVAGLSGKSIQPDGYDIILLAGQSNMAGRGVYNAGIDTTNPNVYQWDSYSANGTYQTIIAASDRLTHPEIGAIAPGTVYVGPGMFFGKAYAAATGRRVLLVPACWGGTSMAQSPAASSPWNPYALDTGIAPAATGQSVLYWTAINQVKAAITAAVAALPSSRFVGTLWLQGEGDATNSVIQSTYEAYFTDLIAGFRAQITGASTSWFIIGKMLPEGLTINSGTYPAIDAAHNKIAATTVRCAIASVGTGYNSGDNLHYNAAGERLMGTTMQGRIADAQQRLTTNVPGQVLALAASIPSSTSVSLNWSAPTTGGVVTDYVVQYRTGGGGWSTFAHAASTNPTIQVAGLTASTSYDFQVSASNATGTGTASASATLSTIAAETVSNVRLTSLTGVLEQVNGGGWDYGCNTGATFAATHAGTSSLKLPASTDGYIQWTLNSTYNSGRNWMLGVVLSATDPAYNTGASGYKFAVYVAGTQYSIKINGSATTVQPDVVVAPATGDVLRLRRSGGVWLAEVARSATPTVFTTVYTFATSSNVDSWFAVSANSSAGTGIYNGPLVGGNVA